MTVDPSAATAAEPASAGGGSTTAPAAGQSLGKYQLDRVLGSGGMGIVWSAFDPDLERAVAIKLLHAANNEPTLRSRLLREARAMARLKHPNVLTVYEVGTDANRDYIAMELVDGSSLDEWLATKPARPDILDALFAAGRGLAAAHDAGLVHRDFKPHNVLRSTAGHVYVTDFGLARGQIEDGSEVEQVAVTALPDDLATGTNPRRTRDSVLDSPLTQTGVLIGTPAYMAPEQFVGRAPDPRSDQFAFCITAWEALTGARPYRGSTLQELEAAASAGVRALPPELPPRVRAVLARGLDPSPAARWADMPTLLRELRDALAPPPRRRWSLIIGAAAAVALIAGGAVVLALGGGDDAEAAACADPERAFSDAWSPAKRGSLQALGANAFGAIALLDGVRTQWIAAYRRACALPTGEQRSERLRCLDSVRLDVRSRVQGAISTRRVDVGEIAIAVAPRVGSCDPSVSWEDALEGNIGTWLKMVPGQVQQIELHGEPDHREPPEAPEPPEPPTSVPPVAPL